MSQMSDYLLPEKLENAGQIGFVRSALSAGCKKAVNAVSGQFDARPHPQGCDGIRAGYIAAETDAHSGHALSVSRLHWLATLRLPILKIIDKARGA